MLDMLSAHWLKTWSVTAWLCLPNREKAQVGLGNAVKTILLYPAAFLLAGIFTVETTQSLDAGWNDMDTFFFIDLDQTRI